MNSGWIVTVVSGASGVGKSRVAVPLALRYGVTVTEADDIVTALRALTTPEQARELHFWDTHPEAHTWEPERIALQHIALCEALTPGLRAVIADHVDFDAPLVIEGDYLLPDLVTGLGPEVRAVVISESDEDRLVENFGAREPGAHQHKRAQVSVLVDKELTGRATAIGVPVVAARPWETGLERVDRALRDWPPRR